MSDLDAWAILAAALASFGLGALWYSPLLLLRAWGREAGIDVGQPIPQPLRTFGLGLLFTLVSAAALAWLLGPRPEVVPAVLTGIALGAAVAGASLGINYQFADRSLGLWLIDAGFHTIRFTAMGLVLGVWPLAGAG